MRVAIFLTGLIQDRFSVIPHIKKMFDVIGHNHGIDFDYYCHFWNPQNKYPYYLDDSVVKIKLPSEDSRNARKVVDFLKPKNHAVSSYDEILPYYEKVFDNQLRTQPSEWKHHLKNVLADRKFANKTIHERFFSFTFEHPHNCFREWFHLHSDWCKVVHNISQVFSASKCAKMIASSDMKYDAILKWRYDLVFDYHKMSGILTDIMQQVRGYHTEIAWKGVDWSAPFETAQDIGPNDVVSLGDVWWCTDHETNEKIANDLLKCYTESMYETSSEGGQHTWIYDALYGKMAVPVHLHGKINECIIRYPETLADIFHDADNFSIEHLMNVNIRKKPDSEYKDCLRFSDGSSMEDAAKHFIF